MKFSQRGGINNFSAASRGIKNFTVLSSCFYHTPRELKNDNSLIDYNRDIMSNASSRCSNCMQIHKCQLIEENEERPLQYLP